MRVSVSVPSAACRHWCTGMDLEEEEETGEEPSMREDGSKSAYGDPFASSGDSGKLRPVGVRGSDPVAGCPGNWKKLPPPPVGVGEPA